MGLGTARGDLRPAEKEDQGVSKGRGGKGVQAEPQGSHCAGGRVGGGVGEWQGREGEGRAEERGAEPEEGSTKPYWKRRQGSVSLEAARRGCCSRMSIAEVAKRVHTRAHTPHAHTPCARPAQAPIYNLWTSEENDLRGSFPLGTHSWEAEVSGFSPDPLRLLVG